MKRFGTAIGLLMITAAIFAGGGEDSVISVYKFSDGYSVYYDTDSMQYGYIDKSGSIAISARFDWAEPFVNGLAVVTMEDYSQMAIIDKGGNYFVRPGEWEEIYPADEEGPFVLTNYDSSGERISSLLDYDGTVRETDPNYYAIEGPFHEEFAPITYHLHGGPLLVHGSGEVPDNLRLSLDAGEMLVATHFSEGLCPVLPYEWSMHESGNTKYGFIDYNGNVVIEPQFLSSVYPGAFSDGRAAIPPPVDNDTYLVIDKSGSVRNRFTLPGEYEVRDWHEGPTFYEGLLAVKRTVFDEDTWEEIESSAGFLDYDGNFVIDPVFEDVWSFSEGLAAAQIDGKIGFIDKSGQFIIPPKFEADMMW